jgi:hypothetical protein
MKQRFLVVNSLALVSLLAAAFAISVPDARAFPSFDLMGAREPGPNEVPLIPFPVNGPIAVMKADSIIRTSIDLEENGPKTRYDIFPVDLDGDGVPEQIVQVARITTAGVYSRCWWGIYVGGKLDQVRYWWYSEQRTRMTRLPHPTEPPKDGADSLSVLQAMPEFFPLVDAVNCGDLTGDGREEVALWHLSAFRQTNFVQSVLVCSIVSSEPDGLKLIYRGHALYTAGVRELIRGPISGCYAACFRTHKRARVDGKALDLVLEPFVPMSTDTICGIPLLNELFLPHDPAKFMPQDVLPARDKIPGKWMIARYQDGAYLPLRYVKDVRLD